MWLRELSPGPDGYVLRGARSFGGTPLPLCAPACEQVGDAHITERERVVYGAREILERKCLHGDHFGRCSPGRLPKFMQLGDRTTQGLGLHTGGNPAVAEAHRATQGVWRPTADIL